MRRAHIMIKGYVQGVFFRARTEERAKQLGLTGWVRNIPEGVEAVFEGADDKVKEMLEFCKHGPRGARVTSIEVKEEKYRGEFDSFTIAY